VKIQHLQMLLDEMLAEGLTDVLFTDIDNTDAVFDLEDTDTAGNNLILVLMEIE